jgi:aspartate racemase
LHPQPVAASEKRALGLIVGLGVGAGIFYYRRIAAALEQDPDLGLVLAHADLRKVLAGVRSGDIAGLTEYLGSLLTRLAKAGASLSAISAVAPHVCMTELMRIAPIPIVSVLDSVRAEMEKVPGRRVALFGNRYVIETDMFGSLPDVDIVRPNDAEISLVHGVYTELAVRGHGIPEDRATLNRLGLALTERERVDVVLLAGTDLSMLFESQEPAFPSLDASVVHIRTILERLVGS